MGVKVEINRDVLQKIIQRLRFYLAKDLELDAIAEI